MPLIEIRPARHEDVDAIIELWNHAAENSSRPADTGAAVALLLRRDPEALLVAEDDGDLIGTILAGWDGWRAHLYRLAVHPRRRRQGIGQALLVAGERRLAELGAQRFDAMVLDDNDVGHRLWTAAGYRRQDDWGRWVRTA